MKLSKLASQHQKIQLMSNQANNTGTVLAFNAVNTVKGRRKSKFSYKGLTLWKLGHTFKRCYHFAGSIIIIFSTFKKNSVTEELKKSENKIQMSDILIEGAVLRAFALELDEVRELLKATELKQQEVRKMKEVNEEQLRMVVKL